MSQYYLLDNRSVEQVEALFDQILDETQDVDSKAMEREWNDVPEINVIPALKANEILPVGLA